MNELDWLQSNMGFERWSKVLGDRVMDRVVQGEIPINEALVIARGLYRGTVTANNSIQSTASVNANSSRADDLYGDKNQSMARDAYHRVNWINNPTLGSAGLNL